MSSENSNISRPQNVFFPFAYIYIPNIELVILEPITEMFLESRNRFNENNSDHMNDEEEPNRSNEHEIRNQKKFRLFKTKGGQCSICYKLIRKRTKIPKLKCKHVFHRTCLTKWMRVKENCPMCRFPID